MKKEKQQLKLFIFLLFFFSSCKSIPVDKKEMTAIFNQLSIENFEEETLRDKTDFLTPEPKYR